MKKIYRKSYERGSGSPLVVRLSCFFYFMGNLIIHKEKKEVFLLQIKDSIVYNVNAQYYESVFKRNELLKIKEAIEATLLFYESNNISDEVIEEMAIQNRLKEEQEYNQMANKKEGTKKVDYLYLIRDNERNTLKIGRTLNIKSRIKQLQVGHSSKLELLFSIKGKGDLEKQLHERFSNIRLNGEWFLNDGSIIEYFNNKLK